MNTLLLYIVCAEIVPLTAYRDIDTALQQVALLNEIEEQTIPPEDRVEFKLEIVTIAPDMLSEYLATWNIELKG